MWLNFVVDAFSAQYVGHAHHQVLPRDAMHSADYAVARCLSVCPSVCLSHAGILSKRLNISSNFLLSGSHTILVFPDQMVWQYSDEDPLTGASNADVWKNRPCSENISLFLGNDARYSHSYYGMRIGNRTQAFEWYQFQWPWVILSDFAKYSVTRSIARSLCNSWASCSVPCSIPV